MAVPGQFSTEVRNAPVVKTSADSHFPAADTAAVVTYAAVPTKRHVITGVAWSYSAAPTGGSLTIADGATTIHQVAITAAGPGSIEFPRPIAGEINTAMTVTLAAGSGTVVGKVNVLNHWEG